MAEYEVFKNGKSVGIFQRNDIKELCGINPVNVSAYAKSRKPYKSEWTFEAIEYVDIETKFAPAFIETFTREWNEVRAVIQEALRK